MSDFLNEVIEHFAGEDLQSMEALCAVFEDYLRPDEVNLQDFSMDNLESELLWAVQKRFERDDNLTAILVGTDKSESEYDEELDFIYLIYCPYNKAVSFDMEAIEGYFGDDLVEDYIEKLNKFIDSLNNDTSLKISKISGNYTA